MPSDRVQTVTHKRPGAVLFVCNRNSIRSPMAEAIAKELQRGKAGLQTFVDSAGVDPMMVNGFAVASLADWNIALEQHVSKSLDDIALGEFDLVVSLANSAKSYIEQHCDLESAEHINWLIDDPNEGTGPIDLKRKAFDATRDQLRTHIADLLGL